MNAIPDHTQPQQVHPLHPESVPMSLQSCPHQPPTSPAPRPSAENVIRPRQTYASLHVSGGRMIPRTPNRPTRLMTGNPTKYRRLIKNGPHSHTAATTSLFSQTRLQTHNSRMVVMTTTRRTPTIRPSTETQWITPTRKGMD
jgi:hypothetical protein